MCRYFEEFEERIPRAEMLQLKKSAEDCIRAVDERLVATVCGSFRRGRTVIIMTVCTSFYQISTYCDGIRT